MERRTFLKTSTATGIAAWTAASAGQVRGANDRLRVGLIGCGGRGTFDARLMRGTPEDIQAVAPENYHGGQVDPRLKEPRNVEIAALCDCNESRIASAQRWAPQAKTYAEFRSFWKIRKSTQSSSPPRIPGMRKCWCWRWGPARRLPGEARLLPAERGQNDGGSGPPE